jgi:hypothetical protein
MSTKASVTARVGPSRFVPEMTRQPRQPSALIPFLRSRPGRRTDDVMRPVWSRDSRVAVPLAYDSRWLTVKASPWRSVVAEQLPNIFGHETSPCCGRKRQCSVAGIPHRGPRADHGLGNPPGGVPSKDMRAARRLSSHPTPPTRGGDGLPRPQAVKARRRTLTAHEGASPIVWRALRSPRPGSVRVSKGLKTNASLLLHAHKGQGANSGADHPRSNVARACSEHAPDSRQPP